MSELERAIAMARELSAEDQERLVFALTISRRQETEAEREARHKRIREICGSFADVPTSVDSFLQRKREDLIWEH